MMLPTAISSLAGQQTHANFGQDFAGLLDEILHVIRRARFARVQMMSNLIQIRRERRQLKPGFAIDGWDHFGIAGFAAKDLRANEVADVAAAGTTFEI